MNALRVAVLVLIGQTPLWLVLVVVVLAAITVVGFFIYLFATTRLTERPPSIRWRTFSLEFPERRENSPEDDR